MPFCCPCFLSLPSPIKRRLKALKKLQSEAIAVESKFFEELHNLECKYENLYRPFMDKVTGMIQQRSYILP